MWSILTQTYKYRVSFIILISLAQSVEHESHVFLHYMKRKSALGDTGLTSTNRWPLHRPGDTYSTSWGGRRAERFLSRSLLWTARLDFWRIPPFIPRGELVDVVCVNIYYGKKVVKIIKIYIFSRDYLFSK